MPSVRRSVRLSSELATESWRTRLNWISLKVGRWMMMSKACGRRHGAGWPRVAKAGGAVCDWELSVGQGSGRDVGGSRTLAMTPDALQRRLSKAFPQEASSWRQATEEVRDLCRRARVLAGVGEDDALDFGKIGRASCRERVCYVV